MTRDDALGVSLPNIRRIAKQTGTDHELAIEEAKALLTFEDWIARDALRELRAPATVARIRR